ncbi:immunoglobulin iota chain-like [Tursiops truncatus]|uniref:immunoglobulin iota chain-like n=1 Tax=Tursiops truncatus TaxID=9739 RepID=UPI003CCFB50D
MSWTPVLLALLAHCTGENPQSSRPPAPSLALLCPGCPHASVSPACGPQPVLNQPPSVSSSLGTTIHLACTLSSDHDVGVHSIYWYQQRAGHPPRFLLRYFSHSDKNQGPKVPPRFSGSKDLAKNTGYLSISDLQPEDEAVYFCAVGAGDMEQGPEMQRERREEREPAAPASQAP